MTVILISADLTVVSRFQGATAQAGLSMRVASSQTAAIDCDAENAGLVVIDLGAPLNDIRAIVEQFKANASPPRIVAFGPHVHEAKLAAAREAGCDEVISRGQFFGQMESLLRG
jgi:DNA-binding NarL/FixJ family response regulator